MKIAQQVTKYRGKEEKLLLRSNFSSFPQYFQYISNFKSPITYTFVKCGCSIYCFPHSAILICRGTDISKYFRESLGIRDNESRLYMFGPCRVLYLISDKHHSKRSQKRMKTYTIYVLVNEFILQSTLVISTSLISNNRLSRSEIMVPVLTWKSKNR